MATNQLSEYVRISKYAQYNSEKKRRETWEEQVERVFKMHKVKFSKHLEDEKFMELFNSSKQAILDKKILGSQRALQFGGPSILNKNTRMYNCAVTYVDRPKVFQEIMFVLLCGAGVGFSVQKHHIDKLPTVTKPEQDEKNEVTYVVHDSIEGWADAIGVLFSSYLDTNQPFPEYHSKYVKFDYTKVRPKGSAIRFTNGKAPGPEGLTNSIEQIRKILNNTTNKLKTIECYDIIMHISDAVLSGGVRRSATICIFSADDYEMITAKTGDWYIKNPQRGRSNNSVLLLRDKTTANQFNDIIESVKQYGEPGFIWAENTESLYNPCCEINMYAYDEKGNSGFSFCNLSEINMSNVTTEEDFYERCKNASILGTLQASYTDFGYLGETTRKIVEREALIGVSMTGMMDCPKLAFDPEILKKGAQVVKETNEYVAKMLGINPAARTTCVKPAGTTSCIFNTASGIHPRYARKYFRRVQSNKTEEPLKYFKKINPNAVTNSVWSVNNSDEVITFLCESNKDAIIRTEISAVEFLEKVKLVQKYWVTEGRNDKYCVVEWLNHNVSNTINIKDDEWKDASEFIYKNRDSFAGISLLSSQGDLVYPQAPFQAVYSHDEIVEMYGSGSLFASGLIVHALNAFDNNLYSACSCLLGTGEKLEFPTLNIDSSESLILADKVFHKLRWIAQAKKFSQCYFNNDNLKMTQCLKLVDAWKTWCDLTRTYKLVDWSQLTELQDNTDHVSYAVCSGGQCEVVKF
jgi:ribonucleoside-triphosphate reductase